MKPEIIMGGLEGQHNADLDGSRSRLEQAKTYRDLSTVCVIPTRGTIPARAVECWMGLMPPMNQKFVRMFVAGMEVGAAYSAAMEAILNHPDLSKWQFMLTLEEDNLPPPDGLLRLYECMDDFDIVGGLYWTKGPEGQPMIYGNPAQPLNFTPQRPVENVIQECHGLGMGFTLFKLDVFREGKIEPPFFETIQQWDPNDGGRGYTQDLHFCERAKKAGYKIACDTRVKVGHLDTESGIVW